MKKTNAAGGFTLVELMVCVVIFAVIAMAVQAVFNSVMKVWVKGDARLSMYQNARAVLDHMSVGIRSTVRPDLFDANHDGKIDAGDTGTAGIRFLGCNQANQAASATITSAAQGAGQGYLKSDQVAYITAMYGNRYEQSEIVGYSYGVANDLGSTFGAPCIFEAKIGTCGPREYSGAFIAANSIRVSPTDNKMLPYGGTSLSSRSPSFFSISNLQMEYYPGNVTVSASLSGSSYWDSSQQSGRLPTMARMVVASDPTIAAIPNPIYVSTYVSITPINGIPVGSGYY